MAKKMRIINTKLGLKIKYMCVYYGYILMTKIMKMLKNYKRILDIKVQNV